MKALVWHEGEDGEDFNVVEIPADLADDAETWRHELIDVVSQFDEPILEKYLGDEEITAEDLRRAIRNATVTRSSSSPSCAARRSRTRACSTCSTPSSTTCPARSRSRPGRRRPEERERSSSVRSRRRAVRGARVQDHERPPRGQPDVRPRLLGHARDGAGVVNSTKGRKERIGRLLQMHANHREDVDSVRTGDIVAAVGLKQTTTGDTLCDPDHPIILEQMEFPEPVIHVAIEPKTKADQEKLGTALGRLSDEDPTFRVRTDEETGQTVIAGMGELHLDVLVDRMMREFGVEANVGKPQVAYRETIHNAVKKVEGRYVRQTGGKGQYGHCYIDLEPARARWRLRVRRQDRRRLRAQGVRLRRRRRHPGVAESGVLAGYPMVDLRVTMVDGSTHDVDSSEMAFKIAGSLALQGGAPARPSPSCSSPS